MIKQWIALVRSLGGKENRLFLKILSYFLSLLIPIVIIGVGTYLYSVQMMKHEFTERIAANLASAAATIDLYLETAQETSVDFFYDDMVQQLLIPRTEHTLEMKTQLSRLPKIIQRSENIVSDFTDRMFVYVDDKDLYVGGGVNEFESFFGSMYRYENYDAAFWRGKLSSDKPIELLPVTSVRQQETRVTKQVVPVVMVNRIQRHNAIVVLNIMVEAVERTLRGNTVFDATGFVVTDGQGQVMYDPDGLMAAFGLSPGMLQDTEASGLSRELKLDGWRYEISHAKSNLYGWDYYSFTPASEFNRHTLSILQMTLLLSLVLLLMGIHFAFMFSYRIYSPIRSIRNILLDKSDLWENGLNGPADKAEGEFEQIRQGIRRLTDHHLQYKVRYDQHTSEYVESSFLFLLKGHTINQEQILRETLEAEFGFNRAGYRCCAVYFEFNAAFYEHVQDTERLSVMNGIKKIVWSLLNAEAPAYVLEYRQHMYVGIVNMAHAGEKQQLAQVFERMLHIFRHDLQLYYNMTVGLGRYCDEINDIGTSCNDALTALDQRDAETRFQIVDAEQLSIANRYVYSFTDEQRILNYLKLGNRKGLQEVVGEIVQSNAGRGISYEHLRRLFQEMYQTGLRFLADKGLDAAGLDLRQPQRLFMDTGTDRRESFAGTPQLLAALNSFYSGIMDMAEARPGSAPRSDNLVTLIEKYIQEHYTQDLGLEQIADEMGVSVKYVSRVFKDKTGINLTDYIHQVRMDKAKELLVGTDLRVNEIAEQLGIHSRTTFLRVFKKTEGISPNEYRLLHQAKGEGRG